MQAQSGGFHQKIFWVVFGGSEIGFCWSSLCRYSQGCRHLVWGGGGGVGLRVSAPCTPPMFCDYELWNNNYSKLIKIVQNSTQAYIKGYDLAYIDAMHY